MGHFFTELEKDASANTMIDEAGHASSSREEND